MKRIHESENSNFDKDLAHLSIIGHLISPLTPNFLIPDLPLFQCGTFFKSVARG
jgi:hypothetical protein